jgi:sugar phosphate permease
MLDFKPGHDPRHARRIVLALLCSMSFILYLDRICMGQAIPAIRADLDISKTHMSFVAMAFTIAYGLFEVPTGRLGDRHGSRWVLTRIVLWWSLFTALTAAGWDLFSLIFIRFLFGAGEAGAYPNAARIIARWFPAGDRGRVQGWMMMTGLLGGAVSPAAVGYIIEFFGWRTAFLAFGAIGIAWAYWFWTWFRDDPATHPDVSDEERRLIGAGAAPPGHEPIPWRATLRHPTIWLLGTIVTCSAFTTYLFFTWYPTYLQEARGLKNVASGHMASLAQLGGACGVLLSGYITDYLTRRSGNLRRSRRWLGTAAQGTAAMLLLVQAKCGDAYLSAVIATAACTVLFLQQSTWWSCATEVSGRHVGALFGLLNGLGTVGAVASQYFFGWFADWRERLGYSGRDQYDPAFMIYAAVLVIGAVCWQFVDSSKPVANSGVEPIASDSKVG